jgi:hypothetical protein
VNKSSAFTASLITQHAVADLATIKIKNAPASLCVAKLADKNAAKIGTDVAALGFPKPNIISYLESDVSQSSSFTKGIVSAVRQSSGISYIQTDTAINPGNSGGPLLNSDGLVIGINSMSMNQAEGINVAIAVDEKDSFIQYSIQSSKEMAAKEPATTTPIGQTPSPTTKPLSFAYYRYTNDEYGFSIKHPNSWSSKQSSPLFLYKAGYGNIFSEASLLGIILCNTDELKIKVQGTFNEYIKNLINREGESNYVWSAPSDVTLMDGQTKGKFYMIKWNVLAYRMKTICLVVDLPNNKTLVATCTGVDEDYLVGGPARQPGVVEYGANLDLFKEILMTLVFNKGTDGDSPEQLLSISNLNCDVGIPYPDLHYNSAWSYDVIISWTTSVPATSQVNYIRNNEGFSQEYYSVIQEPGSKEYKFFGEGCPEYCELGNENSCNTLCVNKINYTYRDSKLVTAHKVTLKCLYVGCAVKNNMNIYHKKFFFKVISYDADNTKAESEVNSFQLLQY